MGDISNEDYVNIPGWPAPDTNPRIFVFQFGNKQKGSEEGGECNDDEPYSEYEEGELEVGVKIEDEEEKKY